MGGDFYEQLIVLLAFGEPIDGALAIRLAGLEGGGWKARLVRRVREVLSLQAECRAAAV